MRWLLCLAVTLVAFTVRAENPLVALDAKLEKLWGEGSSPRGRLTGRMAAFTSVTSATGS
jgi:hypothetical protein